MVRLQYLSPKGYSNAPHENPPILKVKGKRKVPPKTANMSYVGISSAKAMLPMNLFE